jgi:cyclohexanecarboxyl-CoA dehydrogenase
MAEFGFTEAQEMFRQEVRTFCRKELAPGAKERAKMDRIPRELLKKIAGRGILGMGLPQKYGGSPGDWVSWGIAAEEFGKVDSAMGIFMVNRSATFVVLLEGTDELCQEWLVPLIKTEIRSGIAFTEPGAGSDLSGAQATAVRDGADYIITGEKNSTIFGMEADFVVTLVKTDPTSRMGLSWFIVPMDAPNVSRKQFRDTGCIPVNRAHIVFDGVRVPARNLIGREHKGVSLGLRALDVCRYILGCGAVGMAQASLDEAIAYSKQRFAFGKPICNFEGISFQLAEHATLIEATRLLCHKAGWLLDRGLPFSKEASMCKWLGCDVARNTIHDALLIHGHVAFTEDYPLEQRLRDIVGYELADAPPQIQKLVIAREIIGREAIHY